MKSHMKMFLCGLLTIALAACQSSGIVEKPVTEVQEIPVNVPSAVERALDDMDYPYTDETEYCLNLVQEYQKTGQWSTPLEAEAGPGADQFDWDSAIEFIEEQPPKTVFTDSVSGMLWQLYAEKEGDSDAIDYDNLEWIEMPDSICMTAQQAANCAGRLARIFSPESEEEIHLLCMKAKNEIAKTERYYWVARIGKPDVEGDPGKWQLIIDAVTGELSSYQNISGLYNNYHGTYQWAEAVEIVQEGEVRDSFQQILDALGTGQPCGEIYREELFMADDTSFLLYDATVGKKVYQITWFLDTGKIGTIERSQAIELVLQTKFTSPLQGELTVMQGLSPSYSGVDYAAPKGAPVYAAIDGEVTMVRPGQHSWELAEQAEHYEEVTIAQQGQHSYGNCVQVTSNDGLIRTIYAHLTDINVEIGQTVTAGQPIGTVGNTGDAPGDCLHFDVRSCLQQIDPTLIDFAKP